MLDENITPAMLIDDFPCPFCTELKTVRIGNLPDGRVCVTHDMPLCKKFKDTDPETYLLDCYESIS